MPISRAGTCTKVHRTSHVARRTSSGFTLMELAVVIAVIALVAALVFPLLPSTEATELRSSARIMAARIRYLQDQAISSKTSYRLHLSLTEASVSVMKIAADGSETPTTDNLLNSQPLKAGIIFADIVTSGAGKVSEGETVINFGPAGLGEFLAIHLKSQGGRFFTVMAYPASGIVKVFDGYQEVAP